jgi:membrane protein implicated in regulation of membrane protease activity
MAKSLDNQGRIKTYLIAVMAAFFFWLAAAALQSAFYEPADFAGYLLPRLSGEMWMRLLLSVVVAFFTINLLDRDARLQELERQMSELRNQRSDQDNG